MHTKAPRSIHRCYCAGDDVACWVLATFPCLASELTTVLADAGLISLLLVLMVLVATVVVGVATMLVKPASAPNVSGAEATWPLDVPVTISEV